MATSRPSCNTVSSRWNMTGTAVHSNRQAAYCAVSLIRCACAASSVHRTDPDTGELPEQHVRHHPRHQLRLRRLLRGVDRGGQVHPAHAVPGGHAGGLRGQVRHAGAYGTLWLGPMLPGSCTGTRAKRPALRHSACYDRAVGTACTFSGPLCGCLHITTELLEQHVRFRPAVRLSVCHGTAVGAACTMAFSTDSSCS